MFPRSLRFIVLLLLGAISIIVSRHHTATQQPTPSLTPLSTVQTAALMRAVQAYDDGDWKTALPIFIQLAALGDARSETDLGQMYYHGLGVKQDADKAYALQLKAVAQHYGKAEDNLGQMFKDRGDEISATHWYSLSAQDGDAHGQLDYGWQFYGGFGVPRDYQATLHWFSLSAAQGEPTGEYALALLYQGGYGVKRDYGHALRLFRAAAAQGQSSAMCQIGGMYEYGDGVNLDYAAAMRWFQESASYGDDCGYVAVGYLYDVGLGVPKNETTALQWYGAAAKDGDATGENDVGAMYHRGSGGVKQDFGLAATWFGLAAAQGDAYGEMNLATLYLNGQGVNHNDVRGFMLNEQAAAQDEPHAEEQLGNAYRLGFATKIDYAQAVKYYSLAAEHGLPQSQAALSYLFETGQGVLRDDVAAYKWYLISKAVTAHPIMEDDERCQEFAALPALSVPDILAHLSPMQTAQAQSQANAWLAAHPSLQITPPAAPQQPHRPVWEFYAAEVLIILLVAQQARKILRRPAKPDGS